MNKVFKEDLEAIIAENIPWEKLEKKTERDEGVCNP